MRRTRTATRRAAMSAGLVLVAVMVGACGGSDDEGQGQSDGAADAAVISGAGGSTGDAVQAAYISPLLRGADPIDVIYDGTGSADQASKLQAQAEIGRVEWDVMEGQSYYYYKRLADEGLLRNVDYEAVGADANALTESARQPWGAATRYVAYVLAYNASKFDQPPTSMSDFFDTQRFPGPRMISNWGTPEANVLQALVADGVAPEDLTPVDLDRAFRKLDTIKDEIAVYYDSGAQQVASLADGRVAMCLCSDGRVLAAAEDNPDIEIVWAGGFRKHVYAVAPKESPNERAAETYLRSVLDPERQATFTAATGISGSNPKSFDRVVPSLKDRILVNPENFEETFELTREQDDYIAENYTEIEDRWTAWISE